FWYAGTLTSALLAFSRCVESNSEYWGKVLFAGNRTWVWLFCATVYGLGLGLFTKPFLFSSYYFTWFFNPYVGYIEDTSLT
ncbi:Protein SRT-20, partial [Aphelenchoides avenae]